MEHDLDSVRDVRRVLWRWGRIDRRIDELMEQMKIAVDRVNDLYQIGGSRPMDGQPHGTVTGDPVFRAVERIQQMRELFAQEIETCEAQIKEAQEFKSAVNDAMKNLLPVQREVIKLRYHDGHSWTYISTVCLYMSEKTARRYEVQACEALANLIEIRKDDRF